MTMSVGQQLIILGIVVLGTMLTRFLPFLVFRSDKPTPKYIQHLGRVLPSAVMGLLVVYSLREINFFEGTHGIPELVSVAVVMLLHVWKRKMFLSIVGGTVVYMMLIQFIF